ncbi:MAG: DUF4440 domain-containing protein [Candidatus Zixiibacteriota bacterium]
MILQNRLKPQWLAVCLLALYASGAAQSKSPDKLAAVKAEADSIAVIIGAALAQKDSVLLASALSDTVGIVLPGDKKLDSKAKAARYFWLLMKTVGGSKLERTRTAIEPIAGHADLAREAGAYRLSRTSEAGVTEEWRGKYTVYWRRSGDGGWMIERLFVTKD